MTAPPTKPTSPAPASNSIDVVDLERLTPTPSLAQQRRHRRRGRPPRPARRGAAERQAACIISNYDNPVKHFVNTKSDAPHTESVIDLK
ncbi:MAG: hypothetical protein WKG07_48975 [Hymenobacter sp.]